MQRLEPALGGTLGDHLPTPHQLGEPLEPLHAEVSIFEQAAQQGPRAVRHNHGARPCQGLDASRQVRRHANRRLLLRAVPDRVTNHDKAGCNANPGCEWRAIHRQSSHSLGQLQAATDRPLDVVLMGPRPAEVNQHTLAPAAGDVPVPTSDHASAALVIGVDHPAHVLGVEPRQKLRRPRQIAKQDRQLPPLGVGFDECCPCLGFEVTSGQLDRPRARLRAQRGNRFEERLAVVKRDAELFQVGLGQVRQDVDVNVTLAKRLLVTLQPQLPQPSRNFHGVLVGVVIPWQSLPA